MNDTKLSMSSYKPLLFKVGYLTESFSSLAAGLHGVSSVLVLLSLLRGVASKHGRTKLTLFNRSQELNCQLPQLSTFSALVVVH